MINDDYGDGLVRRRLALHRTVSRPSGTGSVRNVWTDRNRTYSVEQDIRINEAHGVRALRPGSVDHARGNS